MALTNFMHEYQKRRRIVGSKQNATIKALRKAFADGELTEDGCAAVEGWKTVFEVARLGLRLKTLIVSKSFKSGAKLVEFAGDADIIEVSDDIFRSAVDTESPQGVAALAYFPKLPTLDELLKPDSLQIVAEGIQDPGNLGTIIRSANAFGATAVLLGDQTVSQFNPKVIRASTGSVFRIPCIASKSEAMIKKLKTAKVRLVGTSSHQGTDLESADFTGGVAIFIGSEGSGLSAKTIAQLDTFVRIPIGNVESLNAGVATSIILYEAARQRRTQ